MNATGDVKIFDFGLAREFDPDRKNSNGTYNLTGDTGSPRYMAPEVALSQPYNESADTYSFTILFWQMLQLETPFESYTTVTKFHERVVHKGVRPKLDPEWPNTLHRLLKRGWDARLERRPSMSSIVCLLRTEMNQYEWLFPEEAVWASESGANFDDNASRQSELSYLRIRQNLLSS